MGEGVGGWRNKEGGVGHLEGSFEREGEEKLFENNLFWRNSGCVQGGCLLGFWAWKYRVKEALFLFGWEVEIPFLGSQEIQADKEDNNSQDKLLLQEVFFLLIYYFTVDES